MIERDFSLLCEASFVRDKMCIALQVEMDLFVNELLDSETLEDPQFCLFFAASFGNFQPSLAFITRYMDIYPDFLHTQMNCTLSNLSSCAYLIKYFLDSGTHEEYPLEVAIRFNNFEVGAMLHILDNSVSRQDHNRPIRLAIESCNANFVQMFASDQTLDVNSRPAAGTGTTLSLIQLAVKTSDIPTYLSFRAIDADDSDQELLTRLHLTQSEGFQALLLGERDNEQVLRIVDRVTEKDAAVFDPLLDAFARLQINEGRRKSIFNRRMEKAARLGEWKLLKKMLKRRTVVDGLLVDSDIDILAMTLANCTWQTAAVILAFGNITAAEKAALPARLRKRLSDRQIIAWTGLINM